MRSNVSDSDHEDRPAARVGLSGAPVTDRINVEPPILNGMTASEAKIIATFAFAFWALVGGVLGWWLGFWQVLLVTAVPGTMVTIWMASTRLARIKRNRPDGYYRQAIHIRLATWGLRAPVFISHDGHWELGRDLGLSLSASNGRACRRGRSH